MKSIRVCNCISTMQTVFIYPTKHAVTVQPRCNHQKRGWLHGVFYPLWKLQKLWCNPLASWGRLSHGTRKTVGDCIMVFITSTVGRIRHAITKPSRGHFPLRNHHFCLAESTYSNTSKIDSEFLRSAVVEKCTFVACFICHKSDLLGIKWRIYCGLLTFKRHCS